MTKIKVAINGFGRIGRTTFRALMKRPSIEVVAINDLADSKTLAHLLKYDSVHGIIDAVIGSEGQYIIVNGNKINVYAEKDPSVLPWKKHGVDVVIEATGHNLDRASASKHLQAGAKKVVISAPSTDSDVKTIVLGVNDNLIEKSDVLFSNASCTTNCAAPMIKILDDLWTIEDCYVTTIHSYTGDQRLHDAPHKDLRRARAAALSIIPTSTGAAKAVTKIFPHLEGKVGGCGIRVPVPNGSITDITCVLAKPTSVNEINAAFKKISESSLKGILAYCDEPIVSIDIVGNPHSCVYDSEFTSVVGNMVKVMGWYDNEAGYSNRLADLIQRIS
ncbi:MAG: type I glyceraldehyde-3-phosphate dehydrogenase [Bacteroidetes bacterium]|nr:type I glyceraldehyde-3-phosphate dehydrogenase [Bacteroidota bacterium]